MFKKIKRYFIELKVVEKKNKMNIVFCVIVFIGVYKCSMIRVWKEYDKGIRYD